jgi:hypothetical protein
MKPFITDAFKDGKFVLGFQIEGLPDERLREPFDDACITAYGVPKSHSFQATWLFRLLLDTGWVVDFSSAATEVGNWKEVGSLNLSFKSDHDGNCDGTPWLIKPVSDFKVETMERLIYEDGDVYAECGLILEDIHGREIIVAAGMAPGSVSIAAPFSTDVFQPEFEMNQYQRKLL